MLAGGMNLSNENAAGDQRGDRPTADSQKMCGCRLADPRPLYK